MQIAFGKVEHEGVRRARLMLVVAALSVAPVLVAVPPAYAGSPSEIRARMVGKTGLGWTVTRAELEETLTGTILSLKIQNTSGIASGKVAFYAEYFDAAGARRFTALFSADHNYEHRTDTFQSGETRTLYTATPYLYPSVLPVSVKVWAIGSTALQQNEPSIASELSIPIQAPPVLRPNSRAADKEGQLWLDEEALKKVHGPVAGILFARAIVNLDGSVSNVQVVQAIDQGVGRWFHNFVLQRRFQPAQADSERQVSPVLILVRAMVSLRCLQQKFVPPSASPVVKTYTKSLEGKPVPALTVVLLVPSSPDYASRAMPHPAYFSDAGVGAQWTEFSEESLLTTPSAPGPKLRKIMPPPGSLGCP